MYDLQIYSRHKRSSFFKSKGIKVNNFEDVCTGEGNTYFSIMQLYHIQSS